MLQAGPQAAPPPSTQDVLAYLRLSVGLADGEALRRVLNTPPRKLGPASAAALEAAAAAAGTPLPALLFGPPPPPAPAGGGGLATAALPELPPAGALGLSPAGRAALESFRATVAGCRAAVAEQPLAEALSTIVRLVRVAGVWGGFWWGWGC